MSSNMERVAAMPDASLYVNRDGRRADDCVDSHGGGNLTRSQDPVARAKNFQISKKKDTKSRYPPLSQFFPNLPTYLPQIWSILG